MVMLGFGGFQLFRPHLLIMKSRIRFQNCQIVLSFFALKMLKEESTHKLKKHMLFFNPYLTNNNRFYFILFGNIAYLTISMFKFTTKYYANEVQVPYVVTSRPHNPCASARSSYRFSTYRPGYRPG